MVKFSNVNEVTFSKSTGGKTSLRSGYSEVVAIFCWCPWANDGDIAAKIIDLFGDKLACTFAKSKDSCDAGDTNSHSEHC
ncbi:hypothetical protein D3C71_1882790 [compost metagenome]